MYGYCLPWLIVTIATAGWGSHGGGFDRWPAITRAGAGAVKLM